MANTFYHRKDMPLLYLASGPAPGEYLGDVVFYVGEPEADRTYYLLVPVEDWDDFHKLASTMGSHTFGMSSAVRLENAILQGKSFNIVRWVDDTIPF